MNWANRITLLRIILIPFFVGALIYGHIDRAFWIFSLAVLTDAIDGYIARMHSQKTILGSFLDPLADKLLLTTAFISLAMIGNLPIRLPPWIPLIVISRDIIIILGAALIQMNTGRLDIHPSLWGKLTTFLQMATVLGILVGFSGVRVIWWLMVVFTILSGWRYVQQGMNLMNAKESLENP